jgi:hypothetical protein
MEGLYIQSGHDSGHVGRWMEDDAVRARMSKTTDKILDLPTRFIIAYH